MGIIAMKNIFTKKYIAVLIVTAIIATVGGIAVADVGDTPPVQLVDTPAGIVSIEWINNGDGTFTKQITIDGIITTIKGSERENNALNSYGVEIARVQAKIRLFALKDDLIAASQTPGDAKTQIAVQALIEIIAMLE